jgi:hypothetical protein
MENINNEQKSIIEIENNNNDNQGQNHENQPQSEPEQIDSCARQQNGGEDQQSFFIELFKNCID